MTALTHAKSLQHHLQNIHNLLYRLTHLSDAELALLRTENQTHLLAQEKLVAALARATKNANHRNKQRHLDKFPTVHDD